MVFLLKYLWALPYTLIGYAIGTIGLMTGGRVLHQNGVLEFHGGAASWFLERLPNGQTVLAMTLGYTILGKTRDALEITRDHEMIHVQQYGRWGLFFGPAYLLLSWWVGRQGGDAYRDNPFEVEAYAKAPIRRKASDENTA